MGRRIFRLGGLESTIMNESIMKESVMNESTSCFGSRYLTFPVSPNYPRFNSSSLSTMLYSLAEYCTALCFDAMSCSSYGFFNF